MEQLIQLQAFALSSGKSATVHSTVAGPRTQRVHPDQTNSMRGRIVGPYLGLG